MLEIAILDEGWPACNWQELAEIAVVAVFAHASTPDFAQCSQNVEIAIRLTSDDVVHTLNKKWRGKDKPTNVLSFPMDMPGETDAPEVMLGDIVLAKGVCATEAAVRGITLQAHASHLIVHGVLHLCGFDHIEDVEAEQMESIERDVLKTLGLHNPYEDEN